MVFEVLSGVALLKLLSLHLSGQRKFGTLQGEAHLLGIDGMLRLLPVHGKSRREGTVVQVYFTDLRSNADMNFENWTIDRVARKTVIRPVFLGVFPDLPTLQLFYLTRPRGNKKLPDGNRGVLVVSERGRFSGEILLLGSASPCDAEST